MLSCYVYVNINSGILLSAKFVYIVILILVINSIYVFRYAILRTLQIRQIGQILTQIITSVVHFVVCQIRFAWMLRIKIKSRQNYPDSILWPLLSNSNVVIGMPFLIITQDLILMFLPNFALSRHTVFAISSFQFNVYYPANYFHHLQIETRSSL